MYKKRRLYEALETLNIKNKNSTSLMNIQIEFNNEDIFFLILKEIVEPFAHQQKT